MRGIGKRFVHLLRCDVDSDRHYVGLTSDVESHAGEGEQQVPLPTWSVYAYRDNRDQINIVSGNNKILVLREAGSPSSPTFEKVEEYDLSQLVDGISQMTGTRHILWVDGHAAVRQGLALVLTEVGAGDCTEAAPHSDTRRGTCRWGRVSSARAQ